MSDSRTNNLVKTNTVELLSKYKQGIIQLGISYNEKKFIEDSFTRWYFNADVNAKFVPSADIVNKSDLQFANSHRRCKFNINKVKTLSKKLYDEFKKNTVIKNEIYPNEDNLISSAQLQRIQELYKGKNFESDKNKLIAIYKFIGMNSAHLSIPPMFEGIELFGSPLNTHNKYCSPFQFERKFKSLGSFFKFNIGKSKETVFTANPPFDETIMIKMAKYLEDELNKSKTTKTIIITIPVWDSVSQKKLGIRDFGMDFEAFDILTKSSFLKSHDILDRNEYMYWDYYKQKLISVSYTHLFILSNGSPKYSIGDVKSKWKNYK